MRLHLTELENLFVKPSNFNLSMVSIDKVRIHKCVLYTFTYRYICKHVLTNVVEINNIVVLTLLMSQVVVHLLICETTYRYFNL